MDEAAEFIPEHIQVGRNGHLFLTTGSNNVLQQYTKDQFRLEAQSQWRHLISSRERRLRARGIAYRHMFVPEKLTIYDNFYDKSVINFNFRQRILYLVAIRTIKGILSDRPTWSDSCAGAGGGAAH